MSEIKSFSDYTSKYNSNEIIPHYLEELPTVHP